MVTYLDLANKGRNLESSDDLTVDSVQLDSGDAIDTIAAANTTLADILEYSTDFDFNDYVEDIVLTIGSQTVTQGASSTAWDENVINAIKYVDTSTSNNKLINIIRVPLERAKQLETFLTTSGKPRFFYMNRGTVKVIPAPDAAYTVKVFYQGASTILTKTNINDTVAFPAHFHNSFIAGVHMRLRQAASDPEWEKLERKFYKKLNMAANRNKFGLKKEGAKKFRMSRLNIDRNI